VTLVQTFETFGFDVDQVQGGRGSWWAGGGGRIHGAAVYRRRRRARRCSWWRRRRFGQGGQHGARRERAKS